MNEESLRFYRGLYYDSSDGKPYSGKVYKLYSNGQKMRDGHFDIGTIDGSYTYYDINGTIFKPIKEPIICPDIK